MEAATLTLVGRCVLRTVGLLPRRMEAVGAFHASGDISLRPGTFDAVGDGNPVPGRVRCPVTLLVVLGGPGPGQLLWA